MEELWTNMKNPLAAKTGANPKLETHVTAVKNAKSAMNPSKIVNVGRENILA